MLRKQQIFIMSLVLGLFVVASFFSFPQVDDFLYAHRTFIVGWCESQFNEYFTWNGRYVATAILSSSPLIWGNLTFYRLYPVLLLLSLFGSCVYLVSVLFKDRVMKNEKWFFGLALSYLTLVGLHSISQGLYWIAGAYTYVSSLVYLNVALTSYWKPQKSQLDYLLIMIAAPLLIGSNETIMILWLYTIGATELYHWFKTKKLRKDGLAIFAYSFAFALLVVVAPGNAARAGLFPKSHQVGRTLGNAFLYSFIDPIKFVSAGLVGFTILNFERLKELTTLDEVSRRRWIYLALWCGLIFVSFAPSLWGMGRRPNERTMNVIIYFHLLGFFPIVMSFVKKVPAKMSVMGLVLLAFSMNTFTLLKDLSGPVWNYQRKWAKVIESQGRVVPDVGEMPKSLYFKDIEEAEKAFKVLLQHNPQFFR